MSGFSFVVSYVLRRLTPQVTWSTSSFTCVMSQLSPRSSQSACFISYVSCVLFGHLFGPCHGYVGQLLDTSLRLREDLWDTFWTLAAHSFVRRFSAYFEHFADTLWTLVLHLLYSCCRFVCTLVRHVLYTCCWRSQLVCRIAVDLLDTRLTFAGHLLDTVWEHQQTHGKYKRRLIHQYCWRHYLSYPIDIWP